MCLFVCFVLFRHWSPAVFVCCVTMVCTTMPCCDLPLDTNSKKDSTCGKTGQEPITSLLVRVLKLMLLFFCCRCVSHDLVCLSNAILLLAGCQWLPDRAKHVSVGWKGKPPILTGSILEGLPGLYHLVTVFPFFIFADEAQHNLVRNVQN